MAYLIADTPITYCLVHDEFLYDHAEGQGRHTEACVIGANAISGKSPTFTVMLRNGALWARLPINALCTKPCDVLAIDLASYWDCLSYNLAVHAYAYLAHLNVDCWLRGLTGPVEGRYLFTIDWAESDYSEMPDQHKQHHIIALDTGPIVALPGNRLRWHEPSWVRPYTETPRYKVNTVDWVVERWRRDQSATGQSWSYDNGTASTQEP